MSAQPPPDMHRSSRDHARMRAGLLASLASNTGGSNHRIGDLTGTSATGMSSETLLFDASWEEGGEARSERLVARVAPDPADVPVFPRYDLPGQFRTIRTVGELTDVPVPRPWFCEPDAAVVGAPFFVMGHVDGEVPPDVLPYNFGDSWLFRATPAQQAELQEASISLLARLHAVEAPADRFAHLEDRYEGDTPLRRHVEATRALYRFAASDCGRSLMVEKGLAWLEDHWPADESDAVLCWGDARIGNVLYRDFQPVGVLDWEMACVGPPELDLSWMLMLHRIFEDLAQGFGLPGMPEFLRPDDAAGAYERLTGRTPRDLDWYLAYACVHMGVIFLRTGWRQVHFGERPKPADADELLIHRTTLDQIFG